jgi:hypothetical protein
MIVKLIDGDLLEQCQLSPTQLLHAHDNRYAKYVHIHICIKIHLSIFNELYHTILHFSPSEVVQDFVRQPLLLLLLLLLLLRLLVNNHEITATIL